MPPLQRQVSCESIGLFDDPRRIGYKRQWEQLARERGYRIVDHALVPIGNDEGAEGSMRGWWSNSQEKRRKVVRP